jgi:BsuBI/PstI restriction endonuclease domain/BsuBI/PstI restriction endonuclease HTH domain/C-5 cytosine-specific DNA methylase
MLHLREAARLQSFPDWFTFTGSPYEQLEQIGNAVPPLLGFALAKQVRHFLENPVKAASRSDPVSVVGHSPKEEKIEQAQTILREVGVQLRELTPRRQERAALCLLAVAHLKPTDKWSDAKSHLDDNKVKAMRTRELVAFRNEQYEEGISSGSYDDVRRKDLAILVRAGLATASAKDAAADTNDGTRGYALPVEALALFRAFRSSKWGDALKQFRSKQGDIRDRLAKARELQKVPVAFGGKTFSLSPGPHNQLQKAIIEEFLPRFSKKANVLYVGDTENKTLHQDDAGLKEIGMVPPARGDRLPDVVAYEPKRDWVFLIEAVHSSNPVDEERHELLMRITKECTAGRVFVTAFLTKKAFRKWVTRIAWETEVWIADEPDHLVHFDGERFLGPYSTK